MAPILTDLGDAYVFVRRDFFLSAHNYQISRRFVGAVAGSRESSRPAMLLPEDEKGDISPFALAKSNDPIERAGELIRRSTAPERCSRLGGVFIFADEDSCDRASRLYEWDLSTVRRGRAFGAWNAYDMQIISVLRTPGLPEATCDALWQHYWRGEPGASLNGWGDLLVEAEDDLRVPGVTYEHHREPLWEHLVDGYVDFETEDRSPFV